MNLNHPFSIKSKLTDMVFPCRHYLVSSFICIALLQCIASAYVHCFWGLEIDGPGSVHNCWSFETLDKRSCVDYLTISISGWSRPWPGPRHEFTSGLPATQKLWLQYRLNPLLFLSQSIDSPSWYVPCSRTGRGKTSSHPPQPTASSRTLR
jgi:hypothetical protein